jgi:hypothetical protein
MTGLTRRFSASVAHADARVGSKSLNHVMPELDQAVGFFPNQNSGLPWIAFYSQFHMLAAVVDGRYPGWKPLIARGYWWKSGGSCIRY